MSGREALAGVALLLAACSRTHAPGAGPSPSASSVTAPQPTSSAASAGSEGASLAVPWPSLVRDEQWDAAWRALEALPDADKSTPEMRYLRARVALERGDAAAALPLLAGLESALPLLADDVARRRAEAELEVGPFVEAGEWFAAGATPSSQLDAARAFEEAHDPHRALAAVARVLASDKRTRTQESEARALRVRVADPTGDVERDDARWLATQGADLAAAADAPALVARLDPKHPLTAEELMTRARVLSGAGRLDEALHAIELAASAPGAAKVGRIERLRARGMALFHARGHGGEAAKALSECAAAGGAHAAEDAFYAARALSRVDRDEEAIRGYRDVARRYHDTTWGDQASFFVPYLRMLHGDWHECARGFAGYLRDRPHGQQVREARRDGALCTLLAGDARDAREAFERLVEDEPDPVVSARMADMAALAALRDGDRTHAVARWTDVSRSRPLSWPALVARARLAHIGAPVPPAVDPPSSAPASDPPALLTVSLPPPADLLHRLGLDGDAEMALRDREAAVTRGAGPRASEALCLAYGQLGRARRLFQIAQTLPSAFLASAPTPATRWAWECAFPRPYADDVRDAERAEKLPVGLLWAVMRQESAFDPDAVSPARAVGLMQLMPDTARPVAEELGLPHDDARLTSPSYAIRVGARVLRDLLDRFHGDVPLAVAAYNGGADSIERWEGRAPGMQLDTFVERIPYKETRDYVARVMGNLARYAYLARGDAGVPGLELELR